jgi:hypothetical protein
MTKLNHEEMSVISMLLEDLMRFSDTIACDPFIVRCVDGDALGQIEWDAILQKYVFNPNERNEQ